MGKSILVLLRYRGANGSEGSGNSPTLGARLWHRRVRREEGEMDERGVVKGGGGDPTESLK